MFKTQSARWMIALCSASTALACATENEAELQNGPPKLSLVSPAALESADLIFEGEVVAIEHQLSSIDQDHPTALPHTFVTFKVDRSIAGAAEAPQITLRFLGGPTGDGLFLGVSEQPQFEIGDRELLLVAKNGVSACPLVGCTGGRFHLSEGRVYAGFGDQVWVEKDGQMRLGPGGEGSRPLAIEELRPAIERAVPKNLANKGTKSADPSQPFYAGRRPRAEQE